MMNVGFEQSDLFTTLFDLLPTGALLLAPRWGADDELTDFELVALNPAGQRALGLPAQPSVTLLQQFPQSRVLGTFAYYERAYRTGERLQVQLPYRADGLDSYYYLTAQRTGEHLLVHFADLTMLSANLAQQAVHEATAQTRAAQQVRAEQQQLLRILGEQPLAVATLTGPEHVFTFANERYLALVGHRPVLGAPVAQALPEATGQGFVALLDRVYQSGEPFVGTEIATLLDQAGGGPPRQFYLTFTYQPLRDEQAQVTGVLVTAVDVTGQVLARKQRDLLQQAEVNLAQRQARQRQELLSLLAHAPVAVALLREPDHRLDYWNDLFDELFPGAHPGATFAEALPDLATAEALRELDRLYQSGDSYRGQAVRVPSKDHADAPARYVTFTYQAYREQGQIAGVAVFAQEVTAQEVARQQVEQLNQELEQRVQERTRQLADAQAEAEYQRGELRRIFEQAPVAIAIFRGPNHIIELANALHLALWGRTAAQVLGRPLFEALPEVAGQGYEELLAGVLTTGQPHVAREGSAVLVRQGVPERVFFDFVYQPLREADGTISGVVVVATDITTQVQARQQVEQLNQGLEQRVQERTRQLAEQRTTLSRVLTQAPVAIAILRGPDLVIELANAAVGRIWGREPAAVLGQPYFAALPETAGQGFEQILAGVLATGQPFFVQEAPVQLARAHTGQQALAYVNFGFHPLYDDDGATWALMAVGTEVTEQVLARQRVEASEQRVQQLNQALTASNKELHASNTQLTRTNADLDTFVYTASHDLKAPIINVEGLLEALREELAAPQPQPATVAHLLHLMGDSVARFQTTIGQLAGIAQLQRDMDQPEAESVSLAQLVEAVRLDLVPSLEATQARLTVDASACPPTVRCSARDVRSVIYNLLSNAIKYHAPGRPPLVQLTVGCDETWLTLQVQDNGLGLEPAQQAQLFTLFRRLHTHVEGSGVGLYAIKRLIDNAGGTIDVVSEPGVGSTFTARLPLGYI